MAQQYPSSWKNCATCAYWSGPRETDYWGSWSKVENPSVGHKCIIPRGGWKGHQMQASSSCRDWMKWPALK